ncbi:MAG: hypothetical protein R2742_10545 [Micropruina glycogenica]
MPEISISPDLPAFLQQAAQRRVVSVHARLQADDLTAVGLYHRLCGTRDNTFLLESADNGMWSRWSFVGVNAVATLSEHGGEAVWSGRPIAGLPTGGDPAGAGADAADSAHARRRGRCRRSPRAWSATWPTTSCAGSRCCPTTTSTTWACPSW